MNKKELIEMLKDLDDDTEIITASGNYELRGNYVQARAFRDNFKKVEENFIDDFDHESYSKEVYKLDINGKEALVITG